MTRYAVMIEKPDDNLLGLCAGLAWMRRDRLYNS